MEPVVEAIDEGKGVWYVVALRAEEQQHSQREVFSTTSHKSKNIITSDQSPNEAVQNRLCCCRPSSRLLQTLSPSLHLPVRVESFRDAASRDAEPQLRPAVRQSRVGRRSLHLRPAQLLQRLGAPSQQGRRHEVPQRGAATNKHVSGVAKRRSRTMQP